MDKDQKERERRREHLDDLAAFMHQLPQARVRRRQVQLDWDIRKMSSELIDDYMAGKEVDAPAAKLVYQHVMSQAAVANDLVVASEILNRIDRLVQAAMDKLPPDQRDLRMVADRAGVGPAFLHRVCQPSPHPHVAQLRLLLAWLDKILIPHVTPEEKH